MSQQPSAPDRLLNVRELAALLGVAPGSVYHWISENRLPVVRFSKRCVRFRQSEITAMLERLNAPAWGEPTRTKTGNER